MQHSHIPSFMDYLRWISGYSKGSRICITHKAKNVCYLPLYKYSFLTTTLHPAYLSYCLLCWLLLILLVYEP